MRSSSLLISIIAVAVHVVAQAAFILSQYYVNVNRHINSFNLHIRSACLMHLAGTGMIDDNNITTMPFLKNSRILTIGTQMF